MKTIKSFIMVALVTFLSSGIFAIAQQNATCSDIVDSALTLVSNVCSETDRNQACYGNLLMTVEPQPDVEFLKFDAPGDLIDVDDIRSMRLSAMDEVTQEWGIALMQLQANLPQSIPGQNTTFLLFGDVTINDASDLPQLTVSNNTDSTANVRGEPSSNGQLVGQLPTGNVAIANGRNSTNDWIRVQLDDETIGWIASFLLDVAGDVSTLDVVTTDDPVYGPLQAFYLQTGINDAQCEDAPDSGILIQTPEGAGTVEFLINEVTIRLGSTAYVQATPSDHLVITLLEGQAEVTASGKTVTVPAGTQVTVTLDDSLSAVDAPDDPTPYQLDDLQSLPLELLPREITIAEPLSETEIANLSNCVVDASQTVNLRSGPGTIYSSPGTLTSDTDTAITGQVQGDDGFVWWQLSDGSWVRSDIVGTEGNCDAIQTVDVIPAVPTSAPIIDSPADVDTTTDNNAGVSTTGSGESYYLQLNTCSTNTVTTGSNVRLVLGTGLWDTEAEAEAQRSASNSNIAVNGAPLPITRAVNFCNACSPTGYGFETFATWIPQTAGTYSLSANDMHGLWTCTVTVQ